MVKGEALRVLCRRFRHSPCRSVGLFVYGDACLWTRRIGFDKWLRISNHQCIATERRPTEESREGVLADLSVSTESDNRENDVAFQANFPCVHRHLLRDLSLNV